MQVVCTELALADLRQIPKRFARQIVAKVSRLEDGLHGDIKRLTNFDCDYRLRCGDYRVLFDPGGGDRDRASYRAPPRGFKNFTAEIKRKRREVSRLKDDIADMMDHLTILEARAKSAGGKRYSTAEVRKTLGI